MPFNYSKLRGRIVEKYGSQGNFAKAMEWSERTLSYKMQGKRNWTQADISKLYHFLDLTKMIFRNIFNLKVQNF
ncbi:MAG: DUF739 family protein [Eubacterium sp.]